MGTPTDHSPREFFGRHAAAYASSQTHRHGRDLQRMVELLPLGPGDRVLDVATGPGHVAAAIAPRVASVVGIDITPQMGVEFERRMKAEGISNATFLVGDSGDLPSADAEFDQVTCRRSAHHFLDVAAALGEMRRVVRPGGHVAIADMTSPDTPAANRLLNELEIARDPSHRHALSPTQWRDAIAAAGLTLQAVDCTDELVPWERWLSPVRPDGPESRTVEEVLRSSSPEVAAQIAPVESGQRCFHKRFLILIAASR